MLIRDPGQDGIRKLCQRQVYRARHMAGIEFRCASHVYDQRAAAEELARFCFRNKGEAPQDENDRSCGE